MNSAEPTAALALTSASASVRDGFVVPRGDLWVFGYGSLMWNPGFAHDHAAPALLRGYHRAFCIYSTRNRGTQEKPGLVLGLNRGGACRGMVYRVPAAAVAATMDALWAREMTRKVYLPRPVRVVLGDTAVTALAFIADRRHTAYAGDLAFDDTARLISCCSGQRGHNAEYLINTLQHLEELGMRDLRLHKLHLRVLELQAEQAARA